MAADEMNPVSDDGLTCIRRLNGLPRDFPSLAKQLFFAHRITDCYHVGREMYRLVGHPAEVVVPMVDLYL